MSIYLSSGYLDIRKLLSYKAPFVFVVGGRGTGKTYGALDTSIDDGRKIMLMRRTKTQSDLVGSDDFSPLKAVCDDKGMSYHLEPIPKSSSSKMYIRTGDDERCLGYTCSLSTIANMRGFDASDVDLLFYDEFIAEPQERPIKDEGLAFLNAYETMNRNRELKGKDPIQVLCMANAFNLANPIFLELGLVTTAYTMVQRHQELWHDQRRGLLLVILDNSPISNDKKDTALYRLTRGSEFESFSLGNTFTADQAENIKPQPIIEYRPLVTVGEITIYKHKSHRKFYVTAHRSGSPVTFSPGANDLERFRLSYGWIWDEMMEYNIYFENYLCQVLLTKYIQ